MKKNKFVTTLVIACCTFALWTACKKNPDPAPTPSAPACVAGHGGKVTFVVFPEHHGKPIFSHTNYLDSVYVKYNSTEYPATGLKGFDTVFVGEVGEEHVHLVGMKCGQYYLYATGLDTTIHMRVKGGIPFKTDSTKGEIDINVPVTE
jgi:hypothetical protein